jgi:nucleotide-binding universal stress UspA family protein
MLNIKKILLPVDFPDTSLPVIHQAALLARHFHAEVLLLHVVNPIAHTAVVPEEGPELARFDMGAEVLAVAARSGDAALAKDLTGVTMSAMTIKGNPALAIVEVAQQEKVDLIMMPSHGFTFDQFLLGSVTGKVLQGTECPVWTGAHVEKPEDPEFALRNILCAVDFGAHSKKTVTVAKQLVAEFSARLTLAHVTSSVEFWGAGGVYVNQDWKNAIVGPATAHMAQLQQDMGTSADVFIGSGDVPKVLAQAATQTRADLLVLGSRPYGGHLRTHGYGVICAVPIPVLSV